MLYYEKKKICSKIWYLFSFPSLKDNKYLLENSAIHEKLILESRST